MVQLWVNLPARDKASTPRYQAIGAATIPSVALPNGGGTLRVIAGTYDDARGPASTYSPMNVFDARLNKGGAAHLRTPVGWTTLVVVLRGEVEIGGRAVRAANVAHLTSAQESLDVIAREDSLVLILSAEPLREPIAHYGPFVMNTRAELSEAVDDYNRGRFGRIAAATAEETAE
jgi:redox-sensitive bicupin YhaK (pirin superfamily)